MLRDPRISPRELHGPLDLGESIDPGFYSSSPTITVRSPADGSLLGEVPAMTFSEVNEVVLRASEAQTRWAALPLQKRAARVAAMGEAMVAESDVLVELIVRESSKTRIEALSSEIGVAVAHCLELSQSAAKILADRPIALRVMKHREAYVRFAPMGVVGVISPWSSGLAVPMSSVTEGLLAGNAVVVKPSELAPRTILKAQEIALGAGIPEGIFEVITGGPEVAEALIAAELSRVVFTGSSEAGREVAVACARRMIPCSLSLSGNGPLIACADCDIERTARAIVYGAFAHAGQSCASVERVYAHRKIHDEVLARVIDLTRALRVGDPARMAVEVGAVASPRKLDRLEELIRDATQRGGIVSVGGRRIGARHGAYLEPTVLARCDHSMRVMREELFGPLVAVMEVESEEQALSLANDSRYGLCAYVFSRDAGKAEALAERVLAGAVSVNDVLSAYAAVEAPFGGIKHSGMGSAHSDEALRAMCFARTIHVEGRFSGAAEGLWFPYHLRGYRVARAALKALFGKHGIFGPIADLF